MAVYSYRMIESFRSSLNSMAATLFSKTPLVLGADEFLAAFVAPDHIPMLKQVEEICRPTITTYAATTLFTEDGGRLIAPIVFVGKAPVILPEYVRHGMQPTCPQEIKDKVTAWVAERVNFGYAFGDVNDALGYLNDTCGDVEAMSLMLPCLPSIMAGLSTDGDNKAVKRAQKLTSIKRFGKLPRIPRQVTQRLSEASALVNAVTLMQDASPPAQVRFDAQITVSGIASSQRVNVFYQNAEPNTPVPIASFL